MGKKRESYDLFNSLLDANEGELEITAKLTDSALLGMCTKTLRCGHRVKIVPLRECLCVLGRGLRGTSCHMPVLPREHATNARMRRPRPTHWHIRLSSSHYTRKNRRSSTKASKQPCLRIEPQYALPPGPFLIHPREC